MAAKVLPSAGIAKCGIVAFLERTITLRVMLCENTENAIDILIVLHRYLKVLPPISVSKNSAKRSA